uniref:F-box domain-containing protein n=1 Tax=Aegilops tauschii subsp. strangulata TaxID=200361 RepID=A0A453BC64_AEGTS
MFSSSDAAGQSRLQRRRPTLLLRRRCASNFRAVGPVAGLPWTLTEMSKTPPTSVRDLPSEIIVSVFMLLPGKYDRVRMSVACKSWRALYLQNLGMIPPELPWLVLPSTTKPMVHMTCGPFNYKLDLPAPIKDDAEFCGSHEGGWAALAMNTGENVLYNFNSKETLPMPTTMLLEEDLVVQAILKMASFSAPPLPDPAQCVVAAGLAITEPDSIHFAYWQYGVGAHWTRVSLGSRDGLSSPMVDIVYHTQRGCFVCLTDDQNLHFLKPRLGDDGITVMEYRFLKVSLAQSGSEMSMMTNFLQYMNLGTLSGQYIAQSGNEIWFISKYLDSFGNGNRTRWLRVKRLEEHGTSKEDTPYWSVVCELPGRVLFTGLASSRVFQRDDDFSDHAVFLDDRGIRVPGLLEVMFERTDSGMFSVKYSRAKPWPPAGGEEVAHVSNKCPPTWWLH